MIHLLFFTAANHVMRLLNIEIAWQYLLPAELVGVYLLSVLVNRFYEKPVSAMLQRKLKISQ